MLLNLLCRSYSFTRRLALIGISLVLLVAGCSSSSEVALEPDAEPPTKTEVQATGAREPAPQIPEPAPKRVDDGRSLWKSPTNGNPITLELVPSESELILHLRPAALLGTQEGKHLWRSLGPVSESARAAIEAFAGKPLESIDRLILGLGPGASYGEFTTNVRCEPEPSEELPLLRRELEELLETSDQERHLTLMFSPSFLTGDGGSLLTGQWSGIREELLAVTRDEWRAYALSVHFSQPTYWELRVTGDASEPELLSARKMKALSQKWPTQVRETIEGGTWSQHSAKLLDRMPAMFEVLSKHTRRGADQGQAVLNGYLPNHAGHNLLLASELYLAESLGVAREIGSSNETKQPKSLSDRLSAPVTLVFGRESLETAVAILSNTIGVEITISGRDLQLEGITRNQMLSLDVEQRPAAEALVEVLRFANPDTEATGPTDPRQKLVYVVRETPDSIGQIVITTRAAAAKRGESLPSVFTP